MASGAVRIAFVNATYLLFFTKCTKWLFNIQGAWNTIPTTMVNGHVYRKIILSGVSICIMGTGCSALWVKPWEPSPVIRYVK